MNAKNATAATTLTQSTGALVDIQSRGFIEGEPETVQAYFLVSFNGPAGSDANSVTYPRTATIAARDIAIRALVNEMLQRTEPDNSLSALDIQIM